MPFALTLAPTKGSPGKYRLDLNFRISDKHNNVCSSETKTRPGLAFLTPAGFLDTAQATPKTEGASQKSGQEQQEEDAAAQP